MFLNLDIAFSHRRNGWREFSARLLGLPPLSWLAALPITFQKLQRSFAITGFRDKGLKGLAFVVDGPP